MTSMIVPGSASSCVIVVRDPLVSFPALAISTTSPLIDDLDRSVGGHSSSVVLNGLVAIEVIPDPPFFLGGAPDIWICEGEVRKDVGLGNGLLSACAASYMRGLAAFRDWFRNRKPSSGTKEDEAE